MQRLKGYLICATAAFLGLVPTGCSNHESAAPPMDHDFSAVLADGADKVIVETYAEMRDRIAVLHDAVVASAAAPADQSLFDAAAQAWRDARVPWERSEAFLFGPAAFLSLDPSLDSWPVDRQQLQDVLGSDFDLSPEFVADGLGPMLRGYHTIEYLLFRDGAPRFTADVTAREFAYLEAATSVLLADATTLWSAWAVGIDGGKAYADELADAGKSGSRYVSQRAAVLEMIEGMIRICDEVANGKIADPYDEQDPSLVESQFSYNSLADFQDNLRSVGNLYAGHDGIGLDDFVAGRDAALDARLRTEIDTAIAAIAAIPAPFRNNLAAGTQIEAAQAAIDKVMSTLASDIKPLVLE
jgi:putative iron-regulated protein